MSYRIPVEFMCLCAALALASPLSVALTASTASASLAAAKSEHATELPRVDSRSAQPTTVTRTFHEPSRGGADRKYLTFANENPNRGFWANGLINWRYSDVGRNAAISPSQASALSTINSAMAAWSAVCRVTFVYQGTTTALPGLGDGSGIADGQNVIGWANFAGNQTGLTGAQWSGSSFPLPLVEADIGLDNSFNPSLAGTVLHEVGHMLGLIHSNVSGAVLSGPPLTAYNTVSTLQPDDIAGCQSIYGAPLPTSITISGKIGPSNNISSALSGATLCTNGAGITCGTPDGSGNYSCTVDSGWTGSIHPRVNGYRIQARKFSNVTANQTQNMPAVSNAGLSCNLDVDRNGLIEPERDGVAILRRMLGQSQSSMAGLAGACAEESTTAGLFSNAAPANFNVSGNAVAPTTDGLILLRKMRGTPDSALLQSIVESGVSVSTVNNWLAANCAFPQP